MLNIIAVPIENKEVNMGMLAISGLIGGILAVVAGIIVIIWPRIIAWVVGIYLIIFGAFAILAALGIT
jgi:uncharacterized membrane protein HdeD (DUF308 family)